MAGYVHIPYNPANDPYQYISQGLGQLLGGLGQGWAKQESKRVMGEDIQKLQQYQKNQAIAQQAGVQSGFMGAQSWPGAQPQMPVMQSPQMRQMQAQGMMGAMTPMTPYQQAQLNQPELQIVDSGENKAIFDKKSGRMYKTEMPSSRVPSTNVNIQPSAGERTAIAETRASIDSLDNLKSLFDNPNTKTGPIVGRVEPTKGLVGLTTSEQEAFMAATSAFKNSIIKEITGAQMSEVEAKRIMKQIPDITDPPTRWKAKWGQSKKNLEMLQKRRLEILSQAGTKVSTQSQQEQGGQILVNPQTGQRIQLRNGKWVPIQ